MLLYQAYCSLVSEEFASCSFLSFAATAFSVIVFMITTERMITAITTKMQSMPFHIYCREKRKRFKLKFSKIFISIKLLYCSYPRNAPKPKAKLKIKPPAMTEAI